MKYCPKCGTSVDEKAVFCSSCGGSLQESASKQAGGFWKGVAAAVVVLALVVGALWATSGRTPADESATTEDTEEAADAVSVSESSPTVATETSEESSSAVVTEDVGFFGRMLGEEPRVYLTVPAGEELVVELENEISTVNAAAGDGFTANLTQPITVEGHKAIPAGSKVMGHVAHAKRSDKVKGVAELTLEFDRLVTANGQELSIETEALHLQAQSTQRKDATKIGIGAGAGALVGAIVGGKKGAAIGTAVGGGAGTGVVLATRGEEVVLPVGAPITTRLLADITVEAPPSQGETE